MINYLFLRCWTYDILSRSRWLSSSEMLWVLEMYVCGLLGTSTESRAEVEEVWRVLNFFLAGSAEAFPRGNSTTMRGLVSGPWSDRSWVLSESSMLNAVTMHIKDNGFQSTIMTTIKELTCIYFLPLLEFKANNLYETYSEQWFCHLIEFQQYL